MIKLSKNSAVKIVRQLHSYIDSYVTVSYIFMAVSLCITEYMHVSVQVPIHIVLCVYA